MNKKYTLTFTVLKNKEKQFLKEQDEIIKRFIDYYKSKDITCKVYRNLLRKEIILKFNSEDDMNKAHKLWDEAI
jgi:hypothetical protein